jgi:hypothetical protein
MVSTPLVLIIAQYFLSIPSHGKIEYPLTVIIRGVGEGQIGILGYSDPVAFANAYVANHSQATAVTIADMQIYGVLWYGYNFSMTTGTWMGRSFSFLKSMIDTFHSHGWKVGLETTAIAWDGQELYYYLQQNPELAFTDANGMRADGVNNATNLEKNPGGDNVIPDFFANYTVADTANDIPVGSRFIDIYCARLKQMILDGLQWDFWFGTDGWNGFNLQGYHWNSATASSCYSFSLQEENEYGNWSGAILSPNWNTENNTQRASDIIANSTILNQWDYYWQIRFSQMYAQIRQVFIDAGRPGPFYSIGTQDMSSEPASAGNLSPYGMFNVTLQAQYNSFDYYYVDQESTADIQSEYGIGRDQAYVGALVKMQNPNLKPIIGLELTNSAGGKGTRPLWDVEQSYLAQAVNYVWVNGAQYRVCDPSIIMMQYPSRNAASGWTNYTQTDINNLFNFISSIASLLQNVQPVYLGPTYPISDHSSGSQGAAWWGINYTFAQWLSNDNVAYNPSYLNSNMGTLLLDSCESDTGSMLYGLSYQTVDQMWANNQLNLLFWDYGRSKIAGQIFSNSTAESEIDNLLHVTQSAGNTYNYTILNSSDITDPYASWIASPYYGTTYVYDTHDNFSCQYVPQNGFMMIANSTYDSPNRVGIGLYYNPSTGRFGLIMSPSGHKNQEITVPRDTINKMLYWVSNCPINSSQSLLDLKVLNSSGTILIPMQNQRDVGSAFGNMTGWPLSSTLNINASALGLGSVSNYVFYWASNASNLMSFSSWSNVSITLNGMADVLVIKPADANAASGYKGWTQNDVNELLSQIRSMANTLQSAQPLYLGPFIVVLALNPRKKFAA